MTRKTTRGPEPKIRKISRSKALQISDFRFQIENRAPWDCNLKSKSSDLDSAIRISLMDYLLKTEPTVYSFADLQRDKSTVWDGVTNPVAVRICAR